MGAKLGKTKRMNVSSGKEDEKETDVKSKVLSDINDLSIKPISLRKGGVAFFFPLSGQEQSNGRRRVKATHSQEFQRNVAENEKRNETVRKSVSFDDYGDEERMLIEEILQQSREQAEDPSRNMKIDDDDKDVLNEFSEGYGEEDKMLIAEIMRENLLQNKGKLRGQTYQERLEQVRHRRQTKEQELRQKTAAKLRQDALKMIQHEHRQKAALDEKVKQNKLKTLAVKQRCLQQNMAKQHEPDGQNWGI
ncbi:hypothetical protein FSP39_012150 [Pinctada imbricata]|uniref:Uncharacterized protein n=1 Tax=Pinctada imbricata TaxID=66713 RepID=A0AA88Y7J6_PINIB|nr:hypothetical protein FSP39_012150 [Pinctada imbricata]